MSKLERARAIAKEQQTAIGQRLGLQLAHGATLRCSTVDEMRQALTSLASQFSPKQEPASSSKVHGTLMTETLAQIDAFKASMATLRQHPSRLSDDEIAAELTRFGR